MALTDENGGIGATMLVGPTGVGGNYGGFGYPMAYPVMPMMGGYGGWGGGFGGDLSSLIVLFLFAAMFGGFGGGFGGFGGGWGGIGFDFPWLLTGQNQIQSSTADGFRSAAISSQLGDIQTSITTGFSNSEVAACNRAMDAMQTAYTNQIADLNRSFDSQAAITAGQNAIQSQLAKCCCDNQLQTESLRATVLSENCEDRNQALLNTRDILAAQTAGTQRILDKLCDQELQAERRENDQLRQQLSMANLAASQAAQTARLLADNAAQTQAIEDYVRPQINPAYIVPNPYAYNFYPYNGWGNSGCGCGNNFGGFNGNF